MANYNTVNTRTETEEVLYYHQVMTADGRVVTIPVHKGESLTEAIRDQFGW